MLDRPGDYTVGDACKGSRRVVLAVAEGADAGDEPGRAPLELAPRVVEGTELDGHAGADAEEGREGAFVEGEGAFVLPDGEGSRGGGGVGVGCLEADLDDVEGLACGGVLVRGRCVVVRGGVVPISTWAMPPAAPEKRSLAVWAAPLLLLPCALSMSAAESAITAAAVALAAPPPTMLSERGFVFYSNENEMRVL